MNKVFAAYQDGGSGSGSDDDDENNG